MRESDLDLLRIALEKGLLAPEGRERVLADADRAEAMGLGKSVEEILVDEGLLSARQLRSLKDLLGWNIDRPRVGDYEILRRVGLGGMGTVFEARHVRLNLRVALKILLPRYARDPEITRRFLEEARSLARLNHPNLVHAVGSGADGEHYYIAMEYVEGMDLRQAILGEGAIEPSRSLRIVRDVCSALAFLASKGLVHRDVKPANILLGPHDTVKLADAGLIRPAASGKERDRFACGTPHYVAPEQVLRNGAVDSRSDLYSLGATWYHMVAGRPPFVGSSTQEVLRAHVDARPSPPSESGRSVPAAIERTILRWLSKDPAERPGSPDVALEEIRRLVSELAPAPRPAARRSPLPAGPERRRLAILAAAAALLVVAGVLVALLAKPPAGRGGPRAGGPEPPAAEVVPAPRVAIPRPDGEAKSSAPTPASPVSSSGANGPPPPPETGPPPLAIEEPPPPARSEVAPPAAPPGSDRWRSIVARPRGWWGSAETAARSLVPIWRAGVRGRDATRDLEAGFHATSVAMGAWGSGDVPILLRYDLDSRDELLDFRWGPGAWSVGSGRLESLGSDVDLATVAWFSPPLEVEVSLPVPATLVLALGALRVAPGQALDAVAWTEDREAAETIPVPWCPPGTVVVRWLPRSVEIREGGETRRIEAAVPREGRLTATLSRGQSIEFLSIDGNLAAPWASARREALRARRSR